MGQTEPVGQRHSVYLLAASFFGVTRMLLLRWHFALFATAVSHVHAERATTRHRHGPTDGRGSRDPEVMRLAVGAGVGKEKQKKPTKKGKKEAAPRRAAHAAEPVLQRHHARESRFGERCE